MSDTITNTTNTNKSKVFNVYVSKSTTAGTALVTRGSLNKTDTAPTVSGLYVLEETGVYTNLGGINAQSGKLNFASFDGTTWSKVEVAVQEINTLQQITDNVLQNPEFKNVKTPWSLNETFTANVVDGILNINTAGTTDPAVYQVVPSLKAGNYVMSVKIKNKTGTTQPIKIGIAGSGKSIDVKVGDNFNIFNVYIDVNSDLTNAVIVINPNPNVQLEIDSCYLFKANNNFITNLIKSYYANLPFAFSKSITVTEDPTGCVNITVKSPAVVFDVAGGYRMLNPETIVVNHEEIVYLSATKDVYTEVDMSKKGTGQNLYLIKERYDAARTNLRNNLIGINYYGWSPNHPSLEIGTKTNTPFFLSKNITISDENEIVSITSPTNTWLFDVNGGYRKLVTNIDVNHEEAVYLSSAPDSYVEVDMIKKGSGENVYLWKERYDAIRTKQRNNLIGINYYGWSPNHPSLEIAKTITSTNASWMPSKSNIISPFRNHLKPFVQKYFDRTKDVTLVQIGDSISTDLNWTDKRLDANERPPFCTEYNVNSYLEEKLRWKEQKYRRFDFDGIFTEILGGGSSVAKDVDDAWSSVGGSFYYPLTKVIDGGNNAGVSFKLPVNNKRLSLILHTDYQFATQTKVVIAEGNGKVEVWNGTSWVEANEFTIFFKESNTQIVGAVSTFYKDNAQKRLKFRNVDLAEKTITVQNVGSGRFGYWGIEYSPNDYMFTYICAAKGSHSIARLQQYESWMVDEFNPDLVLWQMPVLNESLGVPARGLDSSVFGAKFLNKYNALVGKGYLVLPYILWAATYSQFVDTNGKFLSGLANGNIVSPFADVANIMSVFSSNDYPVIDLFNRITEVAQEKAKLEGGNVYSKALVGSGNNGETFTIDGIHMNKLGSDVVFNLLEPYFNF